MSTKPEWFEIHASKGRCAVHILHGSLSNDATATRAARLICGEARDNGARVVHISVAPSVRQLGGLASILRAIIANGLRAEVVSLGDGKPLPEAVRARMLGDGDGTREKAARGK